MNDRLPKQALKAEDLPSELNGLRMTKQRREVYCMLQARVDHPTATDLYDDLREKESKASLATIYNCLEALVSHSLVKQVNFDREPSRYCANTREHGHFHDQKSGMIHDVHFKSGITLSDVLDLPEGVEVSELELTIRGTIPENPGTPESFSQN